MRNFLKISNQKTQSELSTLKYSLEKAVRDGAEAQAERTVTEDDAIKQDVEAYNKEASDTKTEEKPKSTFGDWLYLAVVGAFSTYAIFWGVKAAIKMHHAAKNH